MLEAARDKAVREHDVAVEKLEECKGVITEHEAAIEMLTVERDNAIKERDAVST